MAMYDFSENKLRKVLEGLFLDNNISHFCYPLGQKIGADNYFKEIYAPLQKAIPDIERRDNILIAGSTNEGNNWVGCCGYYTGTFIKSWLDIPPTGHIVAMRFHEFYRFEEDKVAEIQAVWDIPEVMIQA